MTREHNFRRSLSETNFTKSQSFLDRSSRRSISTVLLNRKTKQGSRERNKERQVSIYHNQKSIKDKLQCNSQMKRRERRLRWLRDLSDVTTTVAVVVLFDFLVRASTVHHQIQHCLRRRWCSSSAQAVPNTIHFRSLRKNTIDHSRPVYLTTVHMNNVRKKETIEECSPTNINGPNTNKINSTLWD